MVKHIACPATVYWRFFNLMTLVHSLASKQSPSVVYVVQCRAICERRHLMSRQKAANLVPLREQLSESVPGMDNIYHTRWRTFEQ